MQKELGHSSYLYVFLIGPLKDRGHWELPFRMVVQRVHNRLGYIRAYNRVQKTFNLYGNFLSLNVDEY